MGPLSGKGSARGAGVYAGVSLIGLALVCLDTGESLFFVMFFFPPGVLDWTPPRVLGLCVFVFVRACLRTRVNFLCPRHMSLIGHGHLCS